MDITSYELRTMKVKELRKLIREAIEQVLSETTIDVANPNMPDSQKQALIKQVRSKTGNPKVGTVEEPVDFVEGSNLKEMAMGNKLSDENMDLSPFANQMISGNSLKDILAYIKENPGATEKQIADAFNFTRQQPVNALISVLRKKMIPKLDKDGNPVKDENGNIIQVPIVTRLDKSGEVIVPKAPGEEEDDEEPVTGVDALFVGKGDSLAQFFDNEPNADGSEDFTPETEPELPKAAEPIKPVGAKAKAAEFTTDNDRLIQKIINLYSTSRTRVKEATDTEGGDLSSKDVSIAAKKSKASAESKFPEELQKLINKIKAEDPEVQAEIINILAKKFASVGYASLIKRIAKEVGTSTQVVEPQANDDLGIEDTEEEDTIDEAYNAEYELRKLQYYAGIIK